MSKLKSMVRMTCGSEEDRKIVAEILVSDLELLKNYAALIWVVGQTNSNKDFKDTLPDIDTQMFFERGSSILWSVKNEVDIKKVANTLIKKSI